MTELTAQIIKPTFETDSQGQNGNYTRSNYSQGQKVNPCTGARGQEQKQKDNSCWWYNKANRTCKKGKKHVSTNISVTIAVVSSI